LNEQIRALTAELERKPTNPELYLRRAEVRRQHGELDLALADIATARRLRPDWTKLSLARGLTLFDAGQIEGAQRVVEEFLKTEPDHAPALVLRGRCKVKLGKPAEAVADYRAALKAFAAPNPDLYVERARLEAAMGRFAEALRGLDEGVERFGAAPALQMKAIEYERQLGNYDGALRRVDKLIEEVKQPGMVLFRAQVLEEAGRLGEARKGFEVVLRETGVRRTEAWEEIREKAREGLGRVEGKLSRMAQTKKN